MYVYYVMQDIFQSKLSIFLYNITRKSNNMSFFQYAYLFRVLRENGKYLSKQAFFMRKNYFNDEANGVLKV